jgi:elongation factor P
MILASQLSVGMTISLSGNYYRVESAVKVNVQKTMQLIRAKLRNVQNDEVIEKNFKPTQKIDEVAIAEHKLEYLYPQDGKYVFLDITTLDLMQVGKDIIGNAVLFLKEGTEVRSTCCGTSIFSIELPQFLELMVSSIGGTKKTAHDGMVRIAKLESGAEVEVPLFVEAGDIVKVDTKSQEYIQRV